jgi:hypothetical protein
MNKLLRNCQSLDWALQIKNFESLGEQGECTLDGAPISHWWMLELAVLPM